MNQWLSLNRLLIHQYIATCAAPLVYATYNHTLSWYAFCFSKLAIYTQIDRNRTYQPIIRTDVNSFGGLDSKCRVLYQHSSHQTSENEIGRACFYPVTRVSFWSRACCNFLLDNKTSLSTYERKWKSRFIRANSIQTIADLKTLLFLSPNCRASMKSDEFASIEWLRCLYFRDLASYSFPVWQSARRWDRERKSRQWHTVLHAHTAVGNAHYIYTYL